jgi:DNA-binding TFAR19-related protein (PDSD5 family)
LEEDLELKLITARKLAQLRKMAERNVPREEKTSKETVLDMLFDRGDEVLKAAYQFYPKETTLIIDQLAKLIREKKIREKISGGELYSIFRNLGLRFNLNTSIKIEERGRLVDLTEKLRKRNED